jgi:CRP/FNR family cyclic AMP-dependent transcriptional regulator
MANKRSPRLSPVVLRRKFGAGMTTRNYRDQEIVFSPGDTADAVFYIQSGTVKLTAVSTRPKKAIIAFLQRGSSFGASGLGGQPLRICTARSIAQSSITRLRKESMVRTLKQDLQFAAQFVAYLLSRIVRIEEDLVNQFFNFSERRLARVLLLFGQNNQGIKAGVPAEGEPVNLGGNGWYHPGQGK